LRSQNAVHNFGCPVVSGVTFLSNIGISNDVICHMSYVIRHLRKDCLLLFIIRISRREFVYDKEARDCKCLLIFVLPA